MGSLLIDNSLGIDDVQVYTWDEIVKHTTRNDKWLVIDGYVYDISQWQHKHPGGARIISHFAGQDATDVWVAMHKDRAYVSKFLAPIKLGRVSEEKASSQSNHNTALEKDFRELRSYVEKSGLLKSNPLFYATHLAHIILLEIIAYMVIQKYDGNWPSFIAAALILATAQAQSGWSQHDYGHLSVMSTSRLNHLMHLFVICHLKGASSHWWNFRHNQHHSKPNVVRKDPDIGAAYLFLVGQEMPERYAKKRRGFMPYDWQHIYFWLVGPPTLLPVYFVVENLYFMFKRRDWLEFTICMSFFVRFGAVYGPLLGMFWSFALYMSMRVIESHWFVMVTQMNHIPMKIELDRNKDWVSTQAAATCNVHQSSFNDWFTGHLNFQLEHHLFPMMPRHNYVKVQPLVKSLFKKHNIDYVEKSLFVAMADIARSLKASGQIWREAYDLYWPKQSKTSEETSDLNVPDEPPSSETADSAMPPVSASNGCCAK